MRNRKILYLTLAFGLLATACGDNPAAPVTPPPPTPEHGWQVVLEASAGSSNISPVAGIRSNVFTGLTLDDFFLVTNKPMVAFHLKGQNDTLNIGHGAAAALFAENYGTNPVSTVKWNWVGNMTATGDSTKVKIGGLNSIYQRLAFDAANNQVGATLTGSHAVTSKGNDFQLIESVPMKGLSYVPMSVVFYKPIVCVEAGSRKITSTGLTIEQSDSTHFYTHGYTAADIIVTCNPDASASASRVPIGDGAMVRFSDYIRNIMTR